MKYSIVIPTRNRMELLNSLLASLAKAISRAGIPSTQYEVIIVDGSDRPPRNEAYHFSHKPLIILHTRRHNAAAARNQGARHARGKFVLFFDDDATVPLDYFKTLCKIDRSVNFDILGCNVLPQRNNPATIFFSLFLSYSRRIGMLHSVNLVIRRDFFSRHIFDEDRCYLPIEDCKYFIDIANSGASIFHSKKLTVIHTRISYYPLLIRLYRYLRSMKLIHKKSPDSFSRLLSNRIYELDDDQSLRERYRGVSTALKSSLLGMTLLFFLMFFARFPSSRLLYQLNLKSHMQRILSYASGKNREEIPGWLFRNEAKMLARLAKTRSSGDILEIGHFCGKSTMVLAKYLRKGEKLHTIDDHSFDSDYNFYYYGQLCPKDSLSEFKKNLSISKFKSRIVAYYEKSANTLPYLTKSFSLVFIDGSHSYQDIALDVKLSSELLKPGGLLTMHDINDIWQGPHKVYQELICDPSFLFMGKTDSLAYFKKI